MGSPTEAAQLAALAGAAEACGRWNMPLLAMVYPRGPRIGNPHDPDLVAHAVNLAAELGADIVKTVYTGSVDTMSQVVRTCPIPVLAAGGAKMTDPGELAMFMRDVLRSGARGVAMGRNVFEAEQPGEIVKVVAGMIDDPAGLLQYI
jgi:2-amino-4,5-dihydroxy-6-oxo-7-(phosphonooxy)heptanoate synthase